MKNLKNPTRTQKESIRKAGLDFREYFVKEDRGDSIVIVHKSTNECKTIEKK